MNTSEILSAIDQEISRLEQARSLLQGSNGPTPVIEGKRRGRPPGEAKPSPAEAAPVKQTRGMSEDGRARIAAAQKARWAVKKKADQKATKTAAPAKKTAAPAKKAAAKKTAAPAKVAAKKAAVTIKPSAPKKAAPPAKKAATKKSAPVKDIPKKSAGIPAKTPARAKAVDAVATDTAPAESTAGE